MFMKREDYTVERTRFSGWFRTYDDIIEDPKILGLSDKLKWFWQGCLCLANRNNGYLPDLADVACKLRRRPKEAAAMLEDLIEHHQLLDRDAAGRISPHNWFQRQFRSDHSTDRSRKSRAKTGTDSARILQGFCEDSQNPNRNSTEISVNPNDGFVDYKPVTNNLQQRQAVAATPPEPDTDTDTKQAAAVELRSKEPAAKNRDGKPADRQAAEILNLCEPVCAKVCEAMTPALLESLRAILGDTPLSWFRDRIRDRFPEIRTLGLLLRLADDAVRNHKQHQAGLQTPQPIRRAESPQEHLEYLQRSLAAVRETKAEFQASWQEELKLPEQQRQTGILRHLANCQEDEKRCLQLIAQATLQTAGRSA